MATVSTSRPSAVERPSIPDRAFQDRGARASLGNHVPRRYVRLAVGSAGGSLAVAALTCAAFRLQLNLSTTSVLLLLLVVIVSLSAGFREATITSLAAVACLDYFFIPPLFGFNVNDPQNWVSLATFEVTALIVSRLSVRVQHQALSEARQRRFVEKLYELSRRILFLDRRRTVQSGIVALIHEVLDVDTVALFDAAEARTETTHACTREIEDLARATYLQDRVTETIHPDRWARVLRLGTASVGALVLEGEDLDAPTVNAVASLAAIALERVRSLDRESHSDAARQAEQLRGAVLDSLAHAFKTPLTAIRVASSGLQETACLTEGEAALLSLIDSESERLNQLTTRLLQMARIDASELCLHNEDVFVAALIGEVTAGCRLQLRGRSVCVAADKRLRVRGDRGMLATALLQLIDNAAKYSSPASPIHVAAAQTDGEAVVSVHNDGPAIAFADRERVFERFYRASGVRHGAPGTGLGLSIVRKIAEAHGGRAWVKSEEGTGTTFFLALPTSVAAQHESERARFVAARCDALTTPASPETAFPRG